MKTYQKPELFYERFELSQHIASCDLQLSFNLGVGEPGCSASGKLNGLIQVDGGFVESDTNCSQKVQGYCYTNSTAITVTHAS